MWKEFSSFLIANPIISIFLALAGGYFIGKFKIKSFSLGSTVGVLLVGLLGRAIRYIYDRTDS